MHSDPDISPSRRAEYDALVRLLVEASDPADAKAREIARLIASSALIPGHLWRAMGLDRRDDLRQLMATHFRPLYDANDRDMRWKKFLYKRLCGWPGFDG